MDINMKMQLKLSRSLQVTINLFLGIFFILLTGCEESKLTFNTDDIIFENVIENNIEIFKRYDSINYKKNKYYQNAIFLSNSADNIIESINNNTLTEDSIRLFNDYLNEYCRMEMFSLNYDELKSLEKSIATYKIKMFQTIAINGILNMFKDNCYPMELVKPILVPRKDVINLGEKFIADVYLVGNNYTNKYLAIVNKDTLKYTSDSNFPTYEEIALKKGEKIINGTVQIYHPGLNSTFKYNISSKYIVK